MGLIILERAGIDDADAGKGEPGLVLEKGDILDKTEEQGMFAAFEQAGVEQAVDVLTAWPARRRCAPLGADLDASAPASTCRASRCARSRRRGRALSGLERSARDLVGAYAERAKIARK